MCWSVAADPLGSIVEWFYSLYGQFAVCSGPQVYYGEAESALSLDKAGILPGTSPDPGPWLGTRLMHKYLLSKCFMRASPKAPIKMHQEEEVSFLISRHWKTTWLLEKIGGTE